jgi:hypothetical protein
MKKLLLLFLIGCGGQPFGTDPGQTDPDGTPWRPGDIAPPPLEEASVSDDGGSGGVSVDAAGDAGEVSSDPGTDANSRIAPDSGISTGSGIDSEPGTFTDSSIDAEPGTSPESGTAPEAGTCIPIDASEVLPYWPAACGNTDQRFAQTIPTYFWIVSSVGCGGQRTPDVCTSCQESYSCGCILQNYGEAAGCTCDDSTGMPALVCGQ